MKKKPQKQKRQQAKVNAVTAGYQVSDELWAVLQPLLPEHVNAYRFGGGRPRVPDRQCADAIFYVFRTGCQWGALDTTGLCPHSTAHDRFQYWVEAGVFLQLWQRGVEEFDELKGLDWSWVSMDGAMTKAPLGGEKNRPQSHGPRQTRCQAERGDRRPRHPRGLGSRGSQSARHKVG